MSDERIDIATVFTVTSNMEMYSEQSRWNRFNAFLVVDSIILLCWASLLAVGDDALTFLLVLLPVVGMLLGPIWAMLGRRSSEYQKRMHDAAKRLEDKHIEGWSLERPYHIIDDVEGQVRDKTWWTKLSSSTTIVTYVPLLFSLLFLSVLGFSVLRAWGCVN